MENKFSLFFLSPSQIAKRETNYIIANTLFIFIFKNFEITIYNTILYKTMRLQKYKKIVYLHRQVLHDQLLQTPPGWERSKGMWLSGAM